MKSNRTTQLKDIGSTTALSAMVEIFEGARGDATAAGILARQARAMLSRLPQPEDQGAALEAFCDELQTFVESVPGMRSPFEPRRTEQKRKAIK